MVSERGSTAKWTPLKLQWSHVFSDMVRERAINKVIACRSRLQWSHVFSDMVRDQRARRYQNERFSFNGAMSFQTW